MFRFIAIIFLNRAFSVCDSVVTMPL